MAKFEILLGGVVVDTAKTEAGAGFKASRKEYAGQGSWRAAVKVAGQVQAVPAPCQACAERVDNPEQAASDPDPELLATVKAQAGKIAALQTRCDAQAATILDLGGGNAEESATLRMQLNVAQNKIASLESGKPPAPAASVADLNRVTRERDDLQSQVAGAGKIIGDLEKRCAAAEKAAADARDLTGADRIAAWQGVANG